MKKYAHLLCSIISLLSVHLQAQVIVQQEHTMHGSKTNCASPGLECANAATPFFTEDGALWLAWTAFGAVSVAKSYDMGRTFSERTEIANHQKSLDTGGDARAVITGDGKNRILVAYGFFKDNNWNAQINVATSTNGGETFGEPRPLVDDSSSQRFPTLSVDTQGHTVIAWIDKRLVAKAKNNGEIRLGGSVAFAWSDDYGQTFDQEIIANPNTCECCRIGLIAISKEQAAIAYRAIFPKGIRDHAIQIVSRSPNSVGKIRMIAEDNWKTDVCPHQGPSVALSKSHTLHSVWYTQGSKRQGLFYARSSDLGRSFSQPLRIGQEGLNETRPFILAIGNKIWVVWKEFDGKVASVWERFSSDDGAHWSQDQLITQTSGYSDHPLLVQYKEKAMLSWLTRSDGYQLIELGEIRK
jgi:hypothetical protein